MSMAVGKSLKYVATFRKYFSTLQKVDLNEIEKNILIRQHKNNVQKIKLLMKSYEGSNDNEVKYNLLNELKNLPNSTNPRLLKYGNKPKVLLCHFSGRDVHAEDFLDIYKKFRTLRLDHLGNLTGHKSYYFKKELAIMEQALVKKATKLLIKHNFKFVSVPDILNHEIIEGCGMSTNSERTQVYQLECDRSLSGTAEMALAGLRANKQLKEKLLPLKLAAVSRCFRAETSGLQEEKGIYRVHQFTKVEMFSICTDKQSEEMIESFKDIQIQFFKNLFLNFRLLDMPPYELGSSAYQKYDIEAWLAGRSFWGEISSCSNCTDYQAHRLNIKYKNTDNELKFVHTVNGTAAAIPRLMMALSNSSMTMDIIKHRCMGPLTKFYNLDKLKKSFKIPGIKLVKSINKYNKSKSDAKKI